MSVLQLLVCSLGLGLCVLIYAPLAVAQDAQSVMKGFATEADQKAQTDTLLSVSTHEKHEILFFMGFALLVSVITTASLGVAMGVFGKPVFLAHMVFAGISVTLALIHAIVAIVWFFPF